MSPPKRAHLYMGGPGNGPKRPAKAPEPRHLHEYRALTTMGADCGLEQCASCLDIRTSDSAARVRTMHEEW